MMCTAGDACSSGVVKGGAALHAAFVVCAAERAAAEDAGGKAGVVALQI
jgi:hypothetical protein